MVKSAIYTVSSAPTSCLHISAWLLLYISLETSYTKKTRMSKRGSKILRYALVNAAHNVVKNNATFKAYYDTKMAQGRTHYNALGYCAGKLVRNIWKMMTDNIKFNLD